MNGIAIAAACILPLDAGAVRDYVDCVVVSHVYDCDKGCHSLSQLVFVRRNHWTGNWDVVDWRMLRVGMRPHYSHARGVWETVWWDGKVFRHVESRWSSERWDAFDPEVIARETLPLDSRSQLTAPEARP